MLKLDLFGKQIPVLARTPELLMRWIELNAFTAAFRTHEGLDPAADKGVDAVEVCFPIGSGWVDLWTGADAAGRDNGCACPRRSRGPRCSCAKALHPPISSAGD